jgi:SAM-dependent methyltransferase
VPAKPSAHIEPAGDWPAGRLERVPACPACGGERRAPLYRGLRDRLLPTPGRWDLWSCGDCGSAYLDPRPDPESIGEAYGAGYVTHEPAAANGVPAGAVGRFRRRVLHGYLNRRFGYELGDGIGLGRAVVPLLPDATARTERLIRNLSFGGPRPRLLDVGCGNGGFLAQMRELGWEVEGIDVDRAALEHARATGVSVREATISDLDPGRERYDAITLGHVIEHLHDPPDALRRLRDLLTPGGMLWLATPNVEALGHRLFRDSWFALDPPRHLVLFSPRGLGGALRDAGFARVEQRPSPAGARWLFPPSVAIERGLNPLDGDPPLPRAVNARRVLAELAAKRRPEVAEELIFAAWTAA